MRIGVFDSGTGGLTVLKELVKVYPNNEYYYYGDTLNLPYGEKSKEELLVLVSKIMDFLIEKKVELIIIACGTISSSIYNELKEKYDILIYDIISPVIKYLKIKNYNKVGLIGTNMTINSKAFEKGIDKEFISVACPKFVPLIESGNYGIDLDNAISEHLVKFKNSNIEALVFGCTHFPIIEYKIKKYLNKKIDYINMGKVLCEIIPLSNDGIRSINLYFSKLNESILNNINDILDCNYTIKEV